MRVAARPAAVDDDRADGAVAHANADQFVQQDHGAPLVSGSDLVRVVRDSLFQQLVPHAEGCGFDATPLICHARCRMASARRRACRRRARRQRPTSVCLLGRPSRLLLGAGGLGLLVLTLDTGQPFDQSNLLLREMFVESPASCRCRCSETACNNSRSPPAPSCSRPLFHCRMVPMLIVLVCPTSLIGEVTFHARTAGLDGIRTRHADLHERRQLTHCKSRAASLPSRQGS